MRLYEFFFPLYEVGVWRRNKDGMGFFQKCVMDGPQGWVTGPRSSLRTTPFYLSKLIELMSSNGLSVSVQISTCPLYDFSLIIKYLEYQSWFCVRFYLKKDSTVKQAVLRSGYSYHYVCLESQRPKFKL